jgi:hypothetical protein
MQIYNSGSGAFHVELVGMPALNAKLARIAEAWEQAADDSTRHIAEDILYDAYHRVHVITGALRDSGHVVRVDKHQYAVVFDTKYAVYEEFRPGHAFLRPAYDEGRQNAIAKTAELIQRATRSAA